MDSPLLLKEFNDDVGCFHGYVNKIFQHCKKLKHNFFKYFLFNAVGIVVCLFITLLFCLSFLPIANITIFVELDYHESVLDMRSNALLTSVEVDAPEHVQSCFVMDTPSLITTGNNTFSITKQLINPQSTVFFAQKLHPKSIITFSFMAIDHNEKLSNVSVSLLKGENEFHRHSLDLITSPVYSVSDVAIDIDYVFSLKDYDLDIYYFVFDSYNEDISVTFQLELLYGGFDTNISDTTCFYGKGSHNFKEGEFIVLSNTKDIFTDVSLRYKGHQLYTKTVLPLSVVFLTFLLITFSVISNRKRRDDEIRFLRHNQTLQTLKRLEALKGENI
ncbi:Transmembrane protein [Entamoeba marina]